jgi:SAM-dependent methyltransferase
MDEATMEGLSEPERSHPHELHGFRYTDDNLAFWTPLFAELGAIESRHDVLDVGCGTGGFAISIARHTGASVVGCDLRPALIAYAEEKARAEGTAVRWVVADAERLPFDDESFDRVLMSLVVHQIRDRGRALAEAFRTLRPGGRLVVRTLTPEDAATRIPFRFVPTLAAAKASEMPTIAELTQLLAQAGFDEVRSSSVVRRRRLRLDEVEARFRVTSRRYPFLTPEEIDEGLARMRADWRRSGEAWVDPRRVHFLVARRG